MAGEIDSSKVRWRQWFGCMVATHLLLTGAVLALQITVDPLGVWSASPTPGFNHRKTGQAGTERIFKIYEYALIKPEVVFLGNSRGAWGLPPRWNNVENEKVYNLSFDAQRLGNARKLVQLMMKTHRPKTIVLNLDTIMMTNTAYDPKDLGGFNKRVRTISMSPLGLPFAKLKETVFSFDAIFQSYYSHKSSTQLPKSRPFYDNGWYTVKGEQIRPQPKEYRESFWRYSTSLHKIVFPSPSSVFELARIVNIAAYFQVELEVSFSPISADHLLSIEARNRIHGVDKIKKQIAKKVPFWDFAYVNSITANRYNFIDSTHYRGVIGEKMLQRMSGSNVPLPPDFGVLVTSKNIDGHLKMTKEKLAVWKKRQKPLFNMLKSAINHKNKAVFETELKRIVPVARR